MTSSSNRQKESGTQSGDKRQQAQQSDRESPASRDGVQGEGNYDAAREYDEAQRKFVESGKVDAAARAAKPQSQQQQQEMEEAERVGKSRAKEEDPAITKPRRDR